MSSDLIYLHIAQALGAVILCGMTGWITYVITEKRSAGLAGFIVAALYAPFYVYSWTPLRDLLGWLITAGVLMLLLSLKAQPNASRRTFTLALVLGFLLGVGLLAREAYALLIPVVWGSTFRLLWNNNKRAWIFICLGTLITLSPLVVRNYLAGAPLLSSSNRFAEAFIQGNAQSAHAYLFVIPEDTKAILEKSGGKGWPVVKETLATHPSIWSWFNLQLSKALSLLDPFESCDNITVTFMAGISPLVDWGIKHWMIITPGICGLALSVIRKDLRHWPLWVLLPPLLASVLIGLPLSRYRQGLVVLWIPWAVYFGWHFTSYVRERRWVLACVMASVVVAGWLSSLGPLARCPQQYYERPIEYAVSVRVYEKLGQLQQAREMERVMLKKFADHPEFREFFQKVQSAEEKLSEP